MKYTISIALSVSVAFAIHGFILVFALLFPRSRAATSNILGLYWKNKEGQQNIVRSWHKQQRKKKIFFCSFGREKHIHRSSPHNNFFLSFFSVSNGYYFFFQLKSTFHWKKQNRRKSKNPPKSYSIISQYKKQWQTLFGIAAHTLGIGREWDSCSIK